MIEAPINRPQAFRRLYSHVPGRAALVLVCAFLMGSLTEGFGLLLLVPLLQVVQGHASGSGGLASRLLEWVSAHGFPLTLGGLLAGFVLLLALRGGIQYAREVMAVRLQTRIVDALRRSTYEALLAAEWRWLANTRKTDHANLLIMDVARVGQGLHFSISLCASGVALCVYLAVAALLSLPMTLVALAIGVPGWLVLRRYRQQAYALGRRFVEVNRGVHGNVQESLAGIRLAKIFGSQGRQMALFTNALDALRLHQNDAVASGALSRSFSQVVWGGLLAAYIYAGLTWWHIPVAELLVLVLIFARVAPLVGSLQQHLHHVLQALPALEEVDALMAECGTVQEPPMPSDPSPLLLETAIVLDHVSVRFDGRESPVLRDLNQRLEVRTTLAVMGPSGAGKSTLADLLAGLLEADEGEVLVDGLPLRGSERLRWRRSVAYVPQDCFLFHASIRENLLLAQPDATADEISDALHRAAAEFVFSLPLGLNTVVGDGGLNLSGGERQRIALARALLMRPSLLILDEATSALDMDNEARVHEALARLRGTLTVLVIGHRPSIANYADRVIQLSEGRVAASGALDEPNVSTAPCHVPHN